MAYLAYSWCYWIKQALKESLCCSDKTYTQPLAKHTFPEFLVLWLLLPVQIGQHSRGILNNKVMLKISSYWFIDLLDLCTVMDRYVWTANACTRPLFCVSITKLLQIDRGLKIDYTFTVRTYASCWQKQEASFNSSRKRAKRLWQQTINLNFIQVSAFYPDRNWKMLRLGNDCHKLKKMGYIANVLEVKLGQQSSSVDVLFKR